MNPDYQPIAREIHARGLDEGDPAPAKSQDLVHWLRGFLDPELAELRGVEVEQ